MGERVIYLEDPDVTLYCGDALEVLRALPDCSVHMCCTSPPFYGLRDYGTGTWEDGDEGCDHLGAPFRTKSKLNENWGAGYSDVNNTEDREPMKSVCSKCGARRIDRQIGLEESPDEWVARLVEVFREVRRVLRDDGTLWVEIGDSYNSRLDGSFGNWDSAQTGKPTSKRKGGRNSWSGTWQGAKPKDLLGQPWLLAFALRADGWYLRSEIIWARPNPMPESVTDRPTKAHSTVFLLSKSSRYFYDQEAIREAYAEGTTDRYAYGYNASWKRAQIASVTDERDSGFRGSADALLGIKDKDLTLDGSSGESPRGPDGRRVTTVKGGDNSAQHRDGERWPASGANARSVWTIPTEPTPFAHFATWPQALVRRMILAGCPEDGIVLDPFGGSGTTAIVARKLGRRAILIELNESYCQLAGERLAQQTLFA